MTVADSAATPTPAVSIPRISWVHPPGGFTGLSFLNGLLRILHGRRDITPGLVARGREP